MERGGKRCCLQLYGLIEQPNHNTGASPFSLVYGTEAVIPIELVRPTVKLAEIVGIPREDPLEVVEVMHDNVASHNYLYQANIKARHEGKVREINFQVGEFVWKIAPHV